MAMTAQLQKMGLDRMSITEQLQVLHDLWDHIALEVEKKPFTPSECEEIDRRLARHAAHPEQAIPWEQVEAAALARLGQ